MLQTTLCVTLSSVLSMEDRNKMWQSAD